MLVNIINVEMISAAQELKRNVDSIIPCGIQK